MRARQIIIGASYEPETIGVMIQAFDAAWATIAANFRDNPQQTDDARIALAEAVLSVTGETSCDVEALKNGALQAMAMDYRTLPYGRPKISN
jgi:hypothetical protein